MAAWADGASYPSTTQQAEHEPRRIFNAFGIPATSIRQYEIGRYMPPPAVRAYLKVIEAEPEVVKRAVAG